MAHKDQACTKVCSTVGEGAHEWLKVRTYDSAMSTVRETERTQTEGLDQGCPMSPHCFAFSIGKAYTDHWVSGEWRK